jgi:hypothetical protein
MYAVPSLSECKISDFLFPNESDKNSKGFGSGLDLDSIRSVDPYPAPEYGSGSRRAKMTHKNRRRRL